MAAWYSNILTTTTSRISNLRANLLGGDADGDTEDDTHVCRVLRAYYTEKGRSFPQWLPPDPKAPPPPVATVVPSGPGVGSRYGGASLSGQGGVQPSSLSSLWDKGNAGQQQQQQPAGGSLRQTARVGGVQGNRLSPFSNRNSDPSGGGPGGPGGTAGGGSLAPRPLPSQRMGSYQSTQSAAGALDRNSGGGAPAGSAQDKLRNLFSSGGGSGSSSAGGSRSQSPAQYGSSQGGGGASYGRGGGGGQGGGYGGGGGGGGERPFVASNAPWATSSDEYQYSGGGGGGGRQGGGLPSGPRRAGGGLPSGPRMR
ncbi:hypothetical protein Sste5346_008436 [Sporothrix stenoceras]|uniref:Mso1 N-terminal domain-containing protein n=1 Tax=Sporothrix stenoceras TaxID=5173 RepID=A0ABR3YQI8_9PEZI